MSEDRPKRGLLARSYALVQLAWNLKHYIPTVASTAFSYYTSSRYHEAWPLSTSLFVALARYSSIQSRARRRLALEQQDGDRDRDRDEIDVVKEVQKNRARIERLIVGGENDDRQPKNGVVFPVSFKVKRRRLGGVLERADSQETGDREIKAEWSAHDSLFAARDRDERSGGDKVVLFLHGGAYCLLSPKTHRPLCLQLSRELKSRVLSVDYRLSPETKFPGALHDAVSAYFYLVQELKVPPSGIMVAGDSAGGNLAQALLQYLGDESLERVFGCVLLSPWIDLTSSFASWDSNASTDYLSLDPNDPDSPARLFIRNEDDLTHPYVSPAISRPPRPRSRPAALTKRHGGAEADGSVEEEEEEGGEYSLAHLPPVFVLAGGSETLRDEITLFSTRWDRLGVDVTHEVFDGGVHVFVAVMAHGIGRRAIERIGEWARERHWFEPPTTTTIAFRTENDDDDDDDDHESGVVRGVGKKTITRGWTSVETGLREAYERKRSDGSTLGRSSTRTTSDHSPAVPAPSTDERFEYEVTVEDAPTVALRPTAHKLAVEALADESRHGPPRKGLTRVVRVKRNPAYNGGFLARLHL